VWGPHSETKSNTQTSNLNAASTAALFDFAIELSYGDPGETKRLRIETKPNTNSNHALPIGIRQKKIIRYSENHLQKNRKQFSGVE